MLIPFKTIMFDNISNNGIETITMDSKHNVNLLNLLIDITLLVKLLENDLLEQNKAHSHLLNIPYTLQVRIHLLITHTVRHFEH